MGLDVYVGSLTRYYLQDWETPAERWARESGTPIKVIRPQDPEDAITDPDEIREAVSIWRSVVSDALEEHLEGPLDWDESDDAPYFADRPTWDGYSSLLLWAAYSEHPDLERPTQCVEDWADDEAYLKSSDEDSDTLYPALLRDTSMWLPSDFDFTFAGEDLAGDEGCFGSSVQLLQQLFDLNANTWAADEATIAQWRQDGCSDDASLEDSARFAYAIFYELARKATQHKLVMKLDF
ncbi:MAG: hypothetical protein H6818_00320 [Phycisphaerales bacterium]|nr:hypothetical protein [Phycisphaerales bacterium]MCB9864959.1 hypothetical protein [Phycisphaerales bacterium]